MSLIGGYGSDSGESDSGDKLSYKDLNDPLDHRDLIPAAPEYLIAKAPDSTVSTYNRYGKGDFQSSKRTLNAVIEPQSYDSALFDMKRKAYLFEGTTESPNNGATIQNIAVISNESKQKRQKLERDSPTAIIPKKSKKSSWDEPSDSGQYTTGDDDESSQSETETGPGNKVSFPRAAVVGQRPVENVAKFTSKFYGKSETDYLGRTYMHVPRDLNINLLKEPGSQECFIPKKQTFSWDGHAGGVNKLQFFPKSGHLLLSGGNDGKILLHDTFHSRLLLRGYFGHRRPVKDLDFGKSNSGKTFASCGFDKLVSVWDTEKGQLVTHFKVKGTPNVVRYNPQAENELLVGLSNNKIEHYDLRAAPGSVDHIIQTYDHHLDAINALTFIADGTKFVSTSDDRSVRVWELGINIPIKFISDPAQYSMPRARAYPSGRYFATQAMDNKIMVYQAHEKFKQNKKKVFGGHDVAGHGIDFAFSPDGKIVMSGGTHGKAYFWDWKTTKLLSTIQVDTKMISCIEAHPQETSKVAMAGASGRIFYYG